MAALSFTIKDSMKKFLLFLLISTPCYATQVVIPTTWQINDSVTNVKLNGINNAFANVINGGLDNTNVDTTNGYFLYKKVGALPSAGTQGSVYYLTADNTLNFDTGSTFLKSVGITATPAQGDILYYNGSAWINLPASTSGLFLKTLGAGANPIWASAVTVDTVQTITGAKTFSATITGNVTGNVTGNLTGNSTGTHTGAVALNGGTISGGTLGQEACETISVSNGADAFCTTGFYMRGQHRDGDGSAGSLYCCKP